MAWYMTRDPWFLTEMRGRMNLFAPAVLAAVLRTHRPITDLTVLTYTSSQRMAILLGTFV